MNNHNYVVVIITEFLLHHISLNNNNNNIVHFLTNRIAIYTYIYIYMGGMISIIICLTIEELKFIFL